MLQADQMLKMSSISLKIVEVVILSENSSCSACNNSYLLLTCEMGKLPKFNTENENLWSIWDISANVHNIFELFTTHSFTNSLGAVSSFPSSSQKSKKPSFSLKKFKNPFSGLRESIRGKRYPQQPGKPIFFLFFYQFLIARRIQQPIFEWFQIFMNLVLQVL